MAVCAEPGCPVLVPKGRCETHQRAHRRAKDVARDPSHPILHSSRWRRTSKAYLARHPWCVGYPKGIHGPLGKLAQVTDHIESVKARPDLAFDQTNLQALCQDCNKRKGIAQEGGFGR